MICLGVAICVTKGRRCVSDFSNLVAGAVSLSSRSPWSNHGITFECGDPRVYFYENFLRAVAHEAGLKPMLIPTPFAAWHALGWTTEVLPSPPITRNQVELMQVDNVCSLEMPGFRELGISLHSDTPADVMESLIKELPRLIPLQNQVARFGVSELVPLQLAYGVGVPCAPNPVYYQMLHH